MQGNMVAVWKAFDGQSKRLVIPVYQRNYDWAEAQCERLVDDLEEIVTENRRKHFFGAIVGRNEDSFTWVVIDGQQRLTTISLLILALVHAARLSEIALEDAELPGKLENNYLRLDGGGDGSRPKVKLKPVKDDAEAYVRLFEGPKHLLETSNVTANYHYFRKRLAATGLSADQIWTAIQRLEVMHLDLEDHDEPQRIFETLNSTGLALAEADKIRNFVLMDLPTSTQNQLYERQWNPMEKNVEFKSDWFIRWYLVTVTSKTPNQDEVYEAFKRFARTSSRPVAEILEEMREYSELARQITHASTGTPALDRALKRYQPLHSDVILPFLMSVLRDHKEDKVPLTDMIRIIELLESYLLRRTVCGMWANALNKIFATAYSDLLRLRTDSQPYPEILIYLLRRRDDSSGRFPDDEEFREELLTRNLYRLRSENRTYFFDSLENLSSKDTRDIASRLESGDLSIEHIMPQTLTAAWRDELGENAEEDHATWLNRLGNLTVTAYNSSYSNSSFTTKLQAENGLAESPYRLNAYIKEQTTWGPEQIEERTRRLADDAVAHWPYAKTDFAPPAVVLPEVPMGAEGSFRNRSIVAYEYGDVTETVGTWAEALPGIVGAIVREHRSRVIAAAEDNPMLSTEDAHVDETAPGWIRVEPGLAVSVASSTNAKVRGLRQLFQQLDLDPEDLVFRLRPARGDDGSGPNSEEAGEGAADSRYAPLLKFGPRFDELAGTAATLDNTAELRREFRSAATPFAVADAKTALGSKRLADLTADVLTTSSVESVLAAIQLTLHAEEVFDDAALHVAILDGRATAWVERLRAA